MPVMTEDSAKITAQVDSFGWTVYLGDAVHRVELGADTALHGRPTSFSCDGVVHRLKLPLSWYGTPPVILPFTIGGAPASLAVSVARLSTMERVMRIPRVFLGGGLGDVWSFELIVDEHRLGTISREPGARSG